MSSFLLNSEFAAANFLFCLYRKLISCTECTQQVKSTYKLSSNKPGFCFQLFRFSCHQRQQIKRVKFAITKVFVILSCYLINMDMSKKNIAQ